MAKLPRLVPAARVRAILGGISSDQLRRLRKAGVVPDPLRGTRLYDMAAVTRALDGKPAADATLLADEAELIERARRWGKSA